MISSQGPPFQRFIEDWQVFSAGMTLTSRCQTNQVPYGIPVGIHDFLDRENAPCQAAGGLGGARRDRTDDLMLAKHALYQLSYGPKRVEPGQRNGSCRSIRGVCQGVIGRPGQTRTADLTLIRRAL